MNTFKKVLFTFIVLIIFFISCELVLSFSDLDIRLIRKILYYSNGDLDLHRVSQSAERLFELVPEASVRGINYGLLRRCLS